ncbi:MAG: sodium:proton antiporter, partial [Muribaculaceae bacterium]|nr:sodium:proton antiporter [Muribaculaceae bacterium]
TLTQIGEFSFIIASLGMSLGVLESNLYPIIVAVSVITIFTTPYFIKMAVPAYSIVERHLPANLQFLIDRYSKQSTDVSDTRRLWKDILSRYLWRVLLYSVVLLAITLVSKSYLFPLLIDLSPSWGKIIAYSVTLVVMLPFLVALSFSSTKPDERMRLHATASFYDVPLVVMRIIRYLIALLFIVYFTTMAFNPLRGWIVGIAVFIFVIAFAGTRVVSRHTRIEKKFMDNLNIRENARSGRNNNLVDDLHQAYIRVGMGVPFVGDRLRNSHLRSHYGVSISSIQRGQLLLPLPDGEMRIFPGDILGVIGTDEQIKALNDDVDAGMKELENGMSAPVKVELSSIKLSETSPIIGVPLSNLNIRDDYYTMLVKVLKLDGSYVSPEPSTVLEAGDTVWVVGDPKEFVNMK